MQTFVSAKAQVKHKVQGQKVTFEPVKSLDPGNSAVFEVTVKGAKAGDVRFKVTMTAAELSSPVMETESTNIYSDAPEK